MKLSQKVLAGVLLLGLTWTIFGFAEGGGGGLNLSLVGGVVKSLPVDNQGSQFTAGYGVAPGVFLTLNGGLLSLEAGAQYLKRKFSIGNMGLEGTYSQSPVLLFLNLGKVISLGGGVYYARALGNLSRTIGSDKRDLQYSGAGLRTFDIGAVGSARIHLFPMSWVGMFVEGRYTLTEVNVATRGIFQFADTQILLGVRLGTL